MKEIIYYFISADTLISVGKKAVVDIVTDYPLCLKRQCITTEEIVISYDAAFGDFETDSAAYRVAPVVTGYTLDNSFLCPDCLPNVNSKLKGMRKGEIELFTAGRTGTGKSTIMLEIKERSAI